MAASSVLTVCDRYVTVEEGQMLWFLWFMCLVGLLQVLKYIVVSSLKKDTHLFTPWTNSSLSVSTAEPPAAHGRSPGLQAPTEPCVQGIPARQGGHAEPA